MTKFKSFFKLTIKDKPIPFHSKLYEIWKLNAIVQ